MALTNQALVDRERTFLLAVFQQVTQMTQCNTVSNTNYSNSDTVTVFRSLKYIALIALQNNNN